MVPISSDNNLALPVKSAPVSPMHKRMGKSLTISTNLVNVETREEANGGKQGSKTCGAAPNRIIPNIYLGNTAAGDEVFTANNKKIAFIINLDHKKKYASKVDHGVEVMNIRVGDRLENADKFLEMCSGEGFDKTDASTWFKKAFERIDYYKGNGQNTLIHCFAGISRSATLVTAYLMRKENISFKEAMKRVAEERDCVDPNVGFCALLKEYEEGLDSIRNKNAKEAWSLVSSSSRPIKA